MQPTERKEQYGPHDCSSTCRKNNLTDVQVKQRCPIGIARKLQVYEEKEQNGAQMHSSPSCSPFTYPVIKSIIVSIIH